MTHWTVRIESRDSDTSIAEFTSAWLTIASGNDNPSRDEWINKVWEYYSVFKRKDILTHAPMLGESEKHSAKWHKPDAKGQILSDATYVKYLEEAGRMVAAQAEGGGFLFNGHRVSIWDDEKRF